MFELPPGSNSWRRVSDQSSVVALTVSPARNQLYATSATQGIRVLAGGRWTTLVTPGPAQQPQWHDPHGCQVRGRPCAGSAALRPRDRGRADVDPARSRVAQFHGSDARDA